MSKSPNLNRIAAAVQALGSGPGPRGVTRVVVCNFSGNTGKTTMARNMLHPMFPDAELIRIETSNESGSGEVDMEVSGRRFEEVSKILFAAQSDIIVDIGSSNLEEVRAGLRRLGDAHEDVDLWVLPCMPDEKMVKDTIKTMRELVSIGVDPWKIVALKNKVRNVDEEMDETFAMLSLSCVALGARFIDTPVLSLSVYSAIASVRAATIDSLVDDTTDYRSLSQEAFVAGDSQAAEAAIAKEYLRKNAKQGYINLQAVRSEIFGRAKAAQIAAA